MREPHKTRQTDVWKCFSFINSQLQHGCTNSSLKQNCYETQSPVAPNWSPLQWETVCTLPLTKPKTLRLHQVENSCEDKDARERGKKKFSVSLCLTKMMEEKRFMNKDTRSRRQRGRKTKAGRWKRDKTAMKWSYDFSKSLIKILRRSTVKALLWSDW